MKKNKAKPQKSKLSFKDVIKKIFNSVHTILIGLIILIALLIIFTYHLMSVNKTFLFNGQSEYVSILNGVITLNYDVNVFVGSDISFIYDEDITVTEYRIGYFVPRGLDVIPFVVIEGADEEGFSLRAILQSGSIFNAFEPSRNRAFFTPDIVSRLDQGLYFIIEATTIDGDQIYDRVPINLSRVSR